MNILSGLSSQLDSGFIEKVSGALGADTKKTGSAIDMALPLLMKGLANNASNKQGAESLSKALSKKHDGGIFDMVDTLISKPEAGEGAGILKHILGGKEASIEKFISKESGLDTGGSTKVLQILAPMVLGALGKEQQNQNLSSDQLSGLLSTVSDALAGKSSLSSDLLTSLLDRDGDGDIKDDLMSMAGKFFTGLIRKK